MSVELQPNAGFFLRGEFTVSLYPDILSGTKSIVHILLKKGNQTELFNFIATGTELCDVTVAELLEDFKYVPSRLASLVCSAFRAWG